MSRSHIAVFAVHREYLRHILSQSYSTIVVGFGETTTASTITVMFFQSESDSLLTCHFPPTDYSTISEVGVQCKEGLGPGLGQQNLA